VDRLIGVFPTEQQEGVRNTVSNVLKAVVAQQLVPKKLGGRAAAVEILFSNHALGSMIREGKTFQIPGVISGGKAEGMVGMDESLQKLVANGVVEGTAALEKAIEKDSFRDWLKTRGVEVAAEA
jgi:twitching motility protein PilT